MLYAPFRREDYIKPTKRETLPQRLLFVDTETTQSFYDLLTDKQDFRLGVFIYVELDLEVNVTYRKVVKFSSVEQFITELLRVNHSKKRILVFGHNIKFDIETMDLPRVFFDMGFEHKYPISNGKTFIWRVKTDKGTFVFCDTSNYTGTSLEQLGKDIALPKQKVNFKTVTEDELFSYCENDVMICEKFILEYLRYIYINRLGEFKLTIASQAFTSWRYRFMVQAPKLHKNDDVNLIEKKSYFGGRTECFKIGEFTNETFYKLDINSQYPFCMAKELIPYEFVSYNTNPMLKSIDLFQRMAYCIYDCTIKTDKPRYPFRSRQKCFYPTGVYRVLLHSPEMQIALDNNEIIHVHGYYLYKAAPIFREFVNEMYALKVRYQNEGNISFRFLTKIILNSLYGRFGQIYRDTKFLGNTGIPDFICQPGYNVEKGYDFIDVNWFGNLYRTFASGLATYSFPCIAAAITSYARALLLFYIEISRWENVLYCDTDSLIVNQTGYDNLSPYIDTEKLGYLKLEGKSNILSIYGAKDYIFGADKHTKGVPIKAFEAIKGLWLYDQFEGFRTWQNRGAQGSPLTARRMKERKQTYDKGKILPNGDIQPHTLISFSL